MRALYPGESVAIRAVEIDGVSEFVGEFRVGWFRVAQCWDSERQDERQSNRLRGEERHTVLRNCTN